MKDNVSGYIDHTLLKANATKQQVIKLCREAEQFNFASVCINPHYVPLAKGELEKSSVKICTVIGFPLGANKSEIKAQEAKKAIADGADEIDMVVNLGALLSNDEKTVIDDILAVRQQTQGKILKVIIETAYLTDSQKISVCQMAKSAKADFVKTSTGFAPSGASVQDIKLMRQTVGEEMGVKASGGIKNLQAALDMLKAGATRLGTSSGVEIVTEKTVK